MAFSFKKLKKILLWTLIVLVLLLVLLFFAVEFFLGSAIVAAVNKIGPDVTRTALTLEDCGVSVLRGRFSMDNFFIGNPEGFKAPHAIKFDRIFIDVDMSTVTSDCIVVDEVLIEGADIIYETNLQTDNLHVILDNVNAFVAQVTGGKAAPAEPSPGSDAPAAGPDQPGKTVVIRSVRVVGPKVGMAIKGTGGIGASVPMPDIELTNLGGNPDAPADGKGLTYGQATAQILDTIILSALDVTQNAGALLKSAGDTASGALQDAGDNLKNATDDAIEQLKNIF